LLVYGEKMPQASRINVKGLHLEFGEIDEYLKRKPYESKRVSSDYDTLRKWDRKLLSYFKPFYAPLCELCCMCTYGKCDLSYSKKGACGINIEKQQAREALSTSVIGASAHAAHARDLVDRLLEKDPSSKLHYDSSIDIMAPISTTVTGIEPKTPADLDMIMSYIERELTNLMASVHTGQEGDAIDFESKALHAGMMDTLSLEIAEIAQINQYKLPTGESETHLLEIGMDVIDRTKPVILCIGHNVAPSAEIIDYAEDIGVEDEIEICGLCCTAIDMGRYSKSSKIVGPISRQLAFLRSGIPDVVVLDEQCIRSDVYEICSEMGIMVIATSDKCSMGLEDMSDENPYKIVNRILQGMNGVLLKDEKKAAMVAVNLAMQLHRNSGKNSWKKSRENCLKCLPCDSRCLPPKKPEVRWDMDINSLIEYCNLCGECDRTCPALLPLRNAIEEAKRGDFRSLSELYEKCAGCGRCMEVCKESIPILDLIRESRKGSAEKFLIRAGRGPVQDIEIRRVGAPIVFGDIPGVISLAGCSNYPAGEVDVQLIAEEFLKRGYIVMAAGCAAMDIALSHDDDGKTLYERYPGDFDRGGLLNLGPCVANSHAIGSAIKIAGIFAKIPMERNTVEIADYILNRIGVCVIGWGAMSQKAFAIITGANRWGIPAVLGPHASKYRRLYLGESAPRLITDRGDGSPVPSEPAPIHLTYAAESINECIVMASKMCIRPNDTPRGRMIKLSNYVDLHMKYYGCIPEDIDLFLRSEKEIPYKHKDEIMNILDRRDWKPREAVREPSIIR